VRFLVLLAACSSSTATPVEHPAEPAKPVIACDVTAQPVHCEPGLPTRTALQAAPFQWCAREQPATRTGTGRQFSAKATHSARAKAPDACCYVEWTWTACD
jgi:hypothetical protein